MQYIKSSRKQHKCKKCGRTIFVGDSYYRNGDNTYCFTCSNGHKTIKTVKKINNNLNTNNQASPLTYKVCSILMRILAVIVVILFGLPFMPIGLIIAGVLAFAMWKIADLWAKMAKDMIANKEEVKQPENKIVENPSLNQSTSSNETMNKLPKTRISSYKLPLFMDDRLLKYKYYDVFVKGTKYRNIDYDAIDINKSVTFEEEPTNEYDTNAIKVICNQQFIGYAPQNNIQGMIKDYLNNEENDLVAYISKIDEANQLIDIAIGFYQTYSDYELDSLEYIEATLIKTTKKDEFGISRYDSIELLSEGDEVTLDSQFDSDLYLVTDDGGNELGELSKSVSERLQEKENDYTFEAYVQEINESSSGKLNVKIRIYLVK